MWGDKKMATQTRNKKVASTITFYLHSRFICSHILSAVTFYLQPHFIYDHILSAATFLHQVHPNPIFTLFSSSHCSLIPFLTVCLPLKVAVTGSQMKWTISWNRITFSQGLNIGRVSESPYNQLTIQSSSIIFYLSEAKQAIPNSALPNNAFHLLLASLAFWSPLSRIPVGAERHWREGPQQAT